MKLFYCTFRRHGRLNHISLFAEKAEDLVRHLKRGYTDVSVIPDLGFDEVYYTTKKGKK